jgi:hypothetical protein
MQKRDNNMSETITYKRATAADLQMIIDHRINLFYELDGEQEPQIEAELRKSLVSYFEKELNVSYFCWYATINNEVVSVGGFAVKVRAGSFKNPSGVWGIYNEYIHSAGAQKKRTIYRYTEQTDGNRPGNGNKCV